MIITSDVPQLKTNQARSMRKLCQLQSYTPKVPGLTNIGTLQRQIDGEGAAAAGCAVDVDVATVHFDDPAHDRKPKAGAAECARPGFIHAIETIEDALPVRLVNADPRVAHGDLGGPVLSRQRE